MRKYTEIKSIMPVGRGHFDIIVEQLNFQKKSPYKITSVTIWRHRTTNTTAIDDFRSDKITQSKNGENELIRCAKLYGTKTILKY